MDSPCKCRERKELQPPESIVEIKIPTGEEKLEGSMYVHTLSSSITLLYQKPVRI
jgi:hypothetical protein